MAKILSVEEFLTIYPEKSEELTELFIEDEFLYDLAHDPAVYDNNTGSFILFDINHGDTNPSHILGVDYTFFNEHSERENKNLKLTPLYNNSEYIKFQPEPHSYENEMYLRHIINNAPQDILFRIPIWETFSKVSPASSRTYMCDAEFEYDTTQTEFSPEILSLIKEKIETQIKGSFVPSVKCIHPKSPNSNGCDEMTHNSTDEAKVLEYINRRGCGHHFSSKKKIKINISENSIKIDNKKVKILDVDGDKIIVLVPPKYHIMTINFYYEGGGCDEDEDDDSPIIQVGESIVFLYRRPTALMEFSTTSGKCPITHFYQNESLLNLRINLNKMSEAFYHSDWEDNYDYFYSMNPYYVDGGPSVPFDENMMYEIPAYNVLMTKFLSATSFSKLISGDTSELERYAKMDYDEFYENAPLVTFDDVYDFKTNEWKKSNLKKYRLTEETLLNGLHFCTPIPIRTVQFEDKIFMFGTYMYGNHYHNGNFCMNQSSPNRIMLKNINCPDKYNLDEKIETFLDSFFADYGNIDLNEFVQLNSDCDFYCSSNNLNELFDLIKNNDSNFIMGKIFNWEDLLSKHSDIEIENFMFVGGHLDMFEEVIELKCEMMKKIEREEEEYFQKYGNRTLIEPELYDLFKSKNLKLVREWTNGDNFKLYEI